MEEERASNALNTLCNLLEIAQCARCGQFYSKRELDSVMTAVEGYDILFCENCEGDANK